MKLRKWQAAAKKITERVARSSKENLVIVNACVGSGKTFVAENAFGDFINLHRDNKTVQMFVTPRIRLCDQQSESIIRTLESEYGLINKKDFQLVHVDCTKNEFNWRNPNLSGDHLIFVICDESLFGSDPAVVNAKVSRWTQWLKNFAAWKNDGYTFGFAAFDEAHNYENVNKYIVKTEESADNFFKVLLLSGTPSAFQKDLTKSHKNCVCSCPPKVAIDNGWIVEPTLNIVQGDESQWARAIVAVLNREKAVCKNEVFKSRIMINCRGIDEIKAINELPFFQQNVGKMFHFISLHSTKSYTDDNNEVKEVKPMVDGVEVAADVAYSKIEHIDDGTAFDDNLPILVAQVQMLGEGINVNSFNACLTSSNSDKTAMQQIGRIVRNFYRKDKSKVEYGHANVYVMFENTVSLANLLNNIEEYDLTNDCYRWGDRIEISNSSSCSSESDDIAELNTMNWLPIDENEDIDILCAYNKTHKRTRSQILQYFMNGFDNDNDGISDIEELENLVKYLHETNCLKRYTSKSFNYKSEVEARKSKISYKKKSDKSIVVKTTEKEVKKPLIIEDVLISWVDTIYNTLHTNPRLKKYWYINHEHCIKLILGNADIARFLAAHLNDNFKNKLGR